MKPRNLEQVHASTVVDRIDTTQVLVRAASRNHEILTEGLVGGPSLPDSDAPSMYVPGPLLDRANDCLAWVNSSLQTLVTLQQDLLERLGFNEVKDLG